MLQEVSDLLCCLSGSQAVMTMSLRDPSVFTFPDATTQSVTLHYVPSGTVILICFIPWFIFDIVLRTITPTFFVAGGLIFGDSTQSGQQNN